MLKNILLLDKVRKLTTNEQSSLTGEGCIIGTVSCINTGNLCCITICIAPNETETCCHSGRCSQDGRSCVSS